MKDMNSNLDKFKGDNPFKTPQGYMDGLNDLIMSQLPVKESKKAIQITFAQRVRPWLYLAAVFAGLGLFFKAVIGPDFIGKQIHPTACMFSPLFRKERCLLYLLQKTRNTRNTLRTSTLIMCLKGN